MGQMEKKAKNRLRRIRLENFVLSTLGTIAVVMTSTRHMVMKLKQSDVDWESKRDPRRRLRETLSKMKRKGLVTFESDHGKNLPRLTPLGRETARRVEIGNAVIKKPLRWDRRWRVVIFDISEKRKHLRERIRRLVTHLGFYRLQDSVWVHPYDCEDTIALLKVDLKIGREVLYIIADVIEFDKPLREHFKLPLEE